MRNLSVILVLSFCLGASALAEPQTQAKKTTPAVAPLTSASAAKSLNIIVISAFNPVLPWSQQVMQGIGQAVKKTPNKITIYVESIYSDRVDTKVQMSLLVKSLELKYENRKIDAIVTDSIEGSRFIEYAQATNAFVGTKKIVFDVMQIYQPNIDSVKNSVSTYTEDIFAKQIEDIFALVPNPKRIALNKSQANLFDSHFNALTEYVYQNLPNTKIEVLDSSSGNFDAQLASLDKNDLYVYFPVFEGRNGSSMPPRDYLREIAPSIKAPIFSFWATFIGEGIVGGYLYDPAIQGESMIKLVESVINETDMLADIDSGSWVYDEKQLTRFNLTLADKDREITLVNLTTNIFEDYPLQIALLVILFISLLGALFYYKNGKLSKMLVLLEKANENAEETAKEAVQLSDAKSKFLAIVSHEIRTPINGIMGVFGLLNNTTMDKRQTKLVNMGQFSAESLLRTVNDILDFSKLESNKLVLEPEGFSPRSLLNEVIQYAQVICELKSIDVVQDLSALVDVPLLGDRCRIRQILDNLVNNAVKFTPDGSVTIGAKITKKNRTFELTFWVKDTGIGISSDDQTRLFQPFNQAQNYLQQSSQGTGLGLSICRELLQIMDGKIALESELGKGTCITVTIPFDKAEMLAQTEQENFAFDVGVLKNSKILLVEDNTINQDITLSQLQYFGMTCDFANNGVECLEALQKKEYDIILMDIQMPILDGYSAAKKIRNSEAGERNTHIPIIALTAHVALDEQQKAFDVGMNRHIHKPINPKHLVVEIHTLLHGT